MPTAGRAATLMIQGTASGVGKSILTAAFCRIYARRGLVVRPFKAQNMSNNADVTAGGGEIGRAQSLQARAARAAPDPRMNPVLLKPLADTRADVVLLGRSRPDLARVAWHDRHALLWEPITAALDTLRDEADLVVIEGAGSPAETNLRRSDVVNMAIARHTGTPVLLAADIDRGGAFAALYGTWALLEPDDRRHIRGFLLNRFRGDPSLLAPAPADLTARTGVPVLGTVPFIRHTLPEEDAAGMASTGAGGTIIAAVRLPHVANFDDVDPVAAEPGVCLRWTDRPAALEDARAIIIPGTRNAPADLHWLWESGLAAALRAHAARGTPVLGICGGYQMLGHTLADPLGIERAGTLPGLGLLDVATTLAARKTTRRTTARIREPAGGLPLPANATVSGYEIHHGVTTPGPGCTVWLADGDRPLGALHDHVRGTYLHGLLHDDTFRAAWLATLHTGAATATWEARLDREIDRVADAVAAAVDLPAIDALLDGGRLRPRP